MDLGDSLTAEAMHTTFLPEHVKALTKTLGVATPDGYVVSLSHSVREKAQAAASW